jgi:hypothetical protein
MKVLMILAVVSTSLSGCVAPNSADPSGYDERVSLVSLLAIPDAHQGKRVKTEGVAYFSEIGDGALFLTREHAEGRFLFNGIRLDLADSMSERVDWKSLHLRHILVQGTFSGPHPGYELRGTISDISSIHLAPDPSAGDSAIEGEGK